MRASVVVLGPLLARSGSTPNTEAGSRKTLQPVAIGVYVIPFRIGKPWINRMRGDFVARKLRRIV